MLGYLYWDPSRYMFGYTLPLLKRPILWYGFFFALGFFLGYFILRYLLTTFLFSKPCFTKEDILAPHILSKIAKESKEHGSFKNKESAAYPSWENKSAWQVFWSGYLNNALDSKSTSSLKPSKKNPFRNYFKLLPMHTREQLEKRFYLESFFSPGIGTIPQKAKFISEKIAFACIVGAVIGARLGDVLFYQSFSHIIQDPLQVFRIWEGGLASHGGAIGVIITLYIYSRNSECKETGLSFLRILDLIAIPTALVGSMIRIGNFMNQEILGTVTQVPWAVIFGHPADGSMPVPRHPVQIYESICYFLLFIGLGVFWKKWFQLIREGRLFGLFLSLLFIFRFVLEYLKVEQSEYLTQSSFLSMGQYLSIPFILVGIFLFFRKK